MTLPIDLSGVNSAALEFYHTYALENGYDGGVLEISTDGGTSYLDLGGSITSGGYTKTISASYGSPIGGRQAWSVNGVPRTNVDSK